MRAVKIKKMPCDKLPDSSLCLLKEGYSFIQNRCFKHKSNIFQTRLLCKNVICISGKEAAKLFYNQNYFERRGAAPKRVQKTLLGENGVQGMDGKAHLDRKQMFMSIMTDKNLALLKEYTKEQWSYNSRKWNKKDIVLFDEAQKLMCQVACRWAGVFLKPDEVALRASDLGKMIDGFGAAGPRHWQGRLARKRSEKWIRDVIVLIRTGKMSALKGTAVHTIAWHRNEYHRLLRAQVAAVELLNIIRPVVAIATYITFGLLAMYDNPQCKQKLRSSGREYMQRFVQEVRRYYPFTPFVGAIVKNDFTWKQYSFKKGTLVLLDVYGINHDPAIWENPYEFDPDRFIGWIDDGFSFIPQGGGAYDTGHRCAGEMVTIEVMKESFDFIVNHLTYQVPKQNLKYRLCRIPALPKSRFVMRKLRRRSEIVLK